MPTTLPDISQDTLKAFARRWNVVELALFGSVFRDDFGPESDIDVLVTFAPDAHPSLFDLSGMQDELETLWGRTVDLMTRRGVEQGHNWIRRRATLNEARTVYRSRET